MIVDGAYKIVRLANRGQIDTYEAETMPSGERVLVHLVSAEGQAQRRGELFQRVRKSLDQFARRGAPPALGMGEFQDTPYIVTADLPEFRALSETLDTPGAQTNEDTWPNPSPGGGHSEGFSQMFGDSSNSSEGGADPSAGGGWGDLSAEDDEAAASDPWAAQAATPKSENDGWMTASPEPAPAAPAAGSNPEIFSPGRPSSERRMIETAPRVAQPLPHETGMSRTTQHRPELKNLRVIDRDSAQPGLTGKARRAVQPEDMARAHQPERYKNPYQRHVAASQSHAPAAGQPASAAQPLDDVFGPAKAAPTAPSEPPPDFGDKTEVMAKPPAAAQPATPPPPVPDAPPAPDPGSVTHWLFGAQEMAKRASSTEVPDRATESWLSGTPSAPPDPAPPDPAPPDPAPPSATQIEASEPAAPKTPTPAPPAKRPPEPVAGQPAPQKPGSGDFTMHFGGLPSAPEAEDDSAAQEESPSAPEPTKDAPTAAPPGDFTMQFSGLKGAGKTPSGDSPTASARPPEPSDEGPKGGEFTELFRGDDRYYEDPGELAKKDEPFLKEEEAHPFERPEPKPDAKPSGGDFTQLFSSGMDDNPAQAEDPAENHPFAERDDAVFAAESGPATQDIKPILADSGPKDPGGFTQLFRPRDEGSELAERPDGGASWSGASGGSGSSGDQDGVSTQLFHPSGAPGGSAAPPSAQTPSRQAGVPGVPEQGGFSPPPAPRPKGPTPGIPGGAAPGGPIGIPSGPRIVPQAATPVAGGGGAPRLDAPPTPARQGWEKPQVTGEKPKNGKLYLWIGLGAASLLLLALIFVGIAMMVGGGGSSTDASAPAEGAETAAASEEGGQIERPELSDLGVSGGHITRPTMSSGTVTRSGIQRPTLSGPALNKPTVTGRPRAYGPRVQDPTLTTGTAGVDGYNGPGIRGPQVYGPGVSGVPGGDTLASPNLSGVGQDQSEEPEEPKSRDPMLFVLLGGAVLLLAGIGVLVYFLVKK